MNDDDKINLLCDQAKSWYGTLTDFIFKHTTIQLIVLGWVITSPEARRYVQNTLAPYAYPMPAVLVLANSLLAFFIYRRVWRKSDTVMSRLDKLSPDVAELFNTYRLSQSFWVSMWCVHLILSVLTVFCLYCT